MIRLNLIPENKKEEIRQAYRFRMVLKWGVELSSILFVFALLLFSINYILLINLRMADQEINSIKSNNEKYKEMEKYDSEIREINSKVATIEKIAGGQLYWSKFLAKLNEKAIPEIEMTNILTKNYAIFLAGKAKNRDDLLKFKENLEKEECFTDVNLPLSNLVSRAEVDFQLDLNIKPECLK
jgi:Tfp pilus assembly protein PilN